jgi:hypothetical protein
VTYCLIHKVEAVLGLWSYIELIGSRTEEDRLRIQRATGTDIELLFDKLSEPIGPDLDLEHRLPLLERSWRSAAGQYVGRALHY